MHILKSINVSDYYYYIPFKAFLGPLGRQTQRSPSVRWFSKATEVHTLYSQHPIFLRWDHLPPAWNPRAWHMEGKSSGARETAIWVSNSATWSCFCFHFCEMGIIIAPVLKAVISIKWNNIWKVPSPGQKQLLLSECSLINVLEQMRLPKLKRCCLNLADAYHCCLIPGV